jgi:hypothetical protein
MAFAATASKRGAVADMNKAAIDVAQALARLSEVTIFELRGEWRRLHRMPPPMRLSRDLLTRGITYKVTKEFAEQPQCRDLVALGLNENFENLAFAVNGTPHVHLASGDRDHHFVEMPMSARFGPILS